jgi:hypothetical protein
MSTESNKHNHQEVEEGSSKKQKMENLPTIPKPAPKYSDKLILTEEEKHIFDTLLDVVKTSGCGSVLRVAGGWVRDKVLHSTHISTTVYSPRSHLCTI